MDETTHGFSRKVIDRALTFDFGEFFPNIIEQFFEPKTKPKILSYPIYSQAQKHLFDSVGADNDASKTTAFFTAINSILKGTPFELAYRAFNELCLTVVSFAPQNEQQLQAVFDDFLMCKILPRIEGDEDKLTKENENLLERLQTELEKELADIWQGERPDLLRSNIQQPELSIEVECRSCQKIKQMQAQLTSGFTSFWP